MPDVSLYVQTALGYASGVPANDKRFAPVADQAESGLARMRGLRREYGAIERRLATRWSPGIEWKFRARFELRTSAEAQTDHGEQQRAHPNGAGVHLFALLLSKGAAICLLQTITQTSEHRHRYSLVHLCLLVIVGKLMKLELTEVMIASNACILGPPTAAALAASKGWQPLIAPGILVGLFGYAIATFIGIALTALFKM